MGPSRMPLSTMSVLPQSRKTTSMPAPAGASAAPGAGDCRGCDRAALACGGRGLSVLALRRGRLLGGGPRHDGADAHGDGEAEGQAPDHVRRPVHAEVHARDAHRHAEDDGDGDHRPAPARGPGDDGQRGGDGRGRRRVAAREGRAGDRDQRVARGPWPLERQLEERVEDERHGDADAEVHGLHHPAGPPQAAEQRGDDDRQEPPGVEPVQRLRDAGERLPAMV